MYDPINPGFYHFWSSGLAGLLGLVLMRSISSSKRSTAHDGSIGWMSSRQFLLLLVLAAWTHIAADVIEHGHLPRIDEGLAGLLSWLLTVVQSV
mgnify:FL=1|jgi:hypothetical protein